MIKMPEWVKDLQGCRVGIRRFGSEGAAWCIVQETDSYAPDLGQVQSGEWFCCGYSGSTACEAIQRAFAGKSEAAIKDLNVSALTLSDIELARGQFDLLGFDLWVLYFWYAAAVRADKGVR